VIDAIRYITDNGAKRRALPADFGIPWRTVFGYFARWAKAGVLTKILDQLRRRIRLNSDRCPWPVRVIIDAQSVKGAGTVSRATRGYDKRKDINGRKRHLIVDQDGLFVDLLVTPADVQERAAARILLTRLHAAHPEIVLVWADNAYGGAEFTAWAQNTLGITIKVVPRPDDAKGFILLPKLLWNLICQVAQHLPWLTAPIGRSVAVAGTAISQGVDPVGVGTSTSRSSSWSSAAWPSSTAARSSSLSGTFASMRWRLSLASRSCPLLESFGV
jgi:transposase